MRVWRSIRQAFFLAAIMGTLGASLWAQLPTATLNGTVTDPQGAAVASARVVITSKATGIVRDATASSNGQYVVTNLDPGQYDIRFEANGLATDNYTLSLHDARARCERS